MLIIVGIAWDWINEKLYWTDACKNTIEVYDPASGYRRILFYSETSDNRDIVVDPTTGQVMDNLVDVHNFINFFVSPDGCIGQITTHQVLKYSECRWMERPRQFFKAQA